MCPRPQEPNLYTRAMARRDWDKVLSASLYLVEGVSINRASEDYLVLTYTGRQDYGSDNIMSKWR